MGLRSRLQRIADWFQPAYDKIKKWDLPPELNKAFDALWAAMTPDIQKALWKILKVMYNKYGPEKAKELLATVVEFLSKLFVVKDSD